MNAKKFLTLGLVTTMMLSSYFSSYALTQDYSSYYNNTKTQKLLKLSQSLEKYIINDTNKKVSSFKNVTLKSTYKKEIWEISSDLKRLNTTLKYSYDSSFNANLALVKEKAQVYKKLRAEIETAVKKGLNPYKITTDDQNKIEQDIISIQKDIISELKTYLDKYSDSDFKETWKANFEISSTLWKVSVNVEKYVNIFSILAGSQESDFLIKISFEWNLPWKSTYKNGKYTKWESIKISWNLALDTNIKIIKNDLYINLKDYKISVQTSDKTQDINTEIKSVTQTLDKFKGKTIHLELPESNQVNQAEAIKKLKAILDILGSNSLLTPFKKIDNNYSLKIKEDTINKINKEVEGETSNIPSFYKELLKYTKDNSKITLFKEISEKWMKWKVSLIKESNSYIIEWNINDSKDDIIYKWKNSLVFTIKNDYISIKSTSSVDLYDFSLIWNNGTLDLTAKTLTLAKGSKEKIISIKWTLSLDKTDLKVNYNSQDIGTIKSTKKDNNYTYEIKLNLKNIIPDNDISINFNWEYNIETWKFNIVKPTDSIEFENPYTTQVWQIRDNTRFVDINTIQTWLAIEHATYNNYPNSLNNMSVDIKDPLDWQTINWCKFWYIYKAIPNKKWINNISYTLSTCLENKENIEKKAKNDWWVDPLRWEVKNY